MTNMTNMTNILNNTDPIRRRGLSSSIVGLDEYAYIDIQRQSGKLSSWRNKPATTSIASNPYQEELEELINLVKKQEERIFTLERKIKFMDI